MVSDLPRLRNDSRLAACVGIPSRMRLNLKRDSHTARPNMQTESVPVIALSVSNESQRIRRGHVT